MKNLNVVNLTPAHRFPETENVARDVHDALTEIARINDVAEVSKNTGTKTRTKKGASIRADVRTVAMTAEQIAESFGKENKSRASTIKRLEREIKTRHEKNLDAFVSLGKEFRAFQIQAEYTKEGKTIVSDTVLDAVLTAHGLEHYTRAERRAYIVVYQRETELNALDEWRHSVAKKRIKPLHELDADSIRSAFDKFDKSKNADDSDTGSDTGSDSEKSDTLEKLLANIVTRANALGIEKKQLIAELNKREF
jgi:hypothetical protein